MANNTFQLKRTSTTGRTPNTTNSSNTQYIAAGELAINMTDGILYSSNGSALIEIGANNTNMQVSNTLTVKAISANGSNGSAGQVLFTNGTAAYWNAAASSGGSSNIQVQNTTPSTPNNGVVYWNNDIGKLLIYYTDGTSNQWVEAAIGGGALSAKGANTQVQFNDSGFSNGSANFTFNKGSNTLTVSSQSINSTGVFVSGKVNATSFTVDTFFTANSSTLAIGTYGNTSTGGFIVNTSLFAVGNSSSNAFVNTTVISIGGNVIANSTGSNNAFNLLGQTWVAPGAIGSTTANTGNFTTANATSFTVGSTFIANSTTLNSNGLVVNSISLNSNGFIANSTGAYVNGSITTGSSLNLNTNNTRVSFTPVAGGSNVYFIQQNDDNFVFYSTNTINQPRAIWSIFANSTTSNVNFSAPVNISSNTGLGLGTASATANGYTYLPNGLLIQWGLVSANASVGNATFPVAFPTACLSVTANRSVVGANGFVAVIGTNTTVAQIRSANQTAVNCYYMAIGY